MSSAFDGLPIELVELIVDCLSDNPTALAALKQTCKRFDYFTETPLYRSLTVRPTTWKQLERSLASKPKRRRLVREVHVDFADEEERSGCTPAEMYASFPNLEVLKIVSPSCAFEDEEEEGGDPPKTMWVTDQRQLQAIFAEASMLRSFQDRIWRSLRSGGLFAKSCAPYHC